MSAPLRILLVDDQPLLLQGFAMILSVEDDLEVVGQVPDGAGAVARLREQGYEGPVIALTAEAMRGDRERALARGFDDYLTKPIDFVQLVAKVSICASALRGASPT